MKRIAIITAALLITTGLSSFAKGIYPSASEKGIYQQSFSKIVVTNDIDVSLTESIDKSIEVSGDEENIRQVEWKIKDGILYLKSKKGSLKGKVHVNLSVSQLKSIDVIGTSYIRSNGGLNSKALKVSINGESYVSIKNTGSIEVNKDGDTDLNVKRWSGDVSIY